MKVTCKHTEVSALDLSIQPHIRESIHLSEIDLVKGRAYEVHGVLFRDEVPWFYVCSEPSDEYPTPICAAFFNTENWSVPADWQLQWHGRSSQLVPRWWAEASNFYERLIDGEPDAVGVFRRNRADKLAVAMERFPIRSVPHGLRAAQTVNVTCKHTELNALDLSIQPHVRDFIGMSEIALVKGRAYEVHGMILRDGVPWFYVCSGPEADYPKPYCVAFFAVGDWSIPTDWQLQWDGYSSHVVPRWWAEVSNFYERLIDGDPDAVGIFRRNRAD